MTKRKKFNVGLYDSHFGKYFRLRNKIPEDCDLIVVCTNDGSGLIPKKVLLPHQLYLKDVNILLKELGVSYHKQVTIIPVRSEECIDLLKKENNK